jgi:hypothetical protein
LLLPAQTLLLQQGGRLWGWVSRRARLQMAATAWQQQQQLLPQACSRKHRWSVLVWHLLLQSSGRGWGLPLRLLMGLVLVLLLQLQQLQQATKRSQKSPMLLLRLASSLVWECQLVHPLMSAFRAPGLISCLRAQHMLVPSCQQQQRRLVTRVTPPAAATAPRGRLAVESRRK